MDLFSKNDALARIQKLKEYRQNLRARERGMNARMKALGSMPEVAATDLKKFEASIQQFLPDTMMPGNVGPLNAVVWPFWSVVDFDFGIDPIVSNNLTQTQSFQVSQEAAYMIMGITADSTEVSLAGSLGPWQIILKDAQSSRQLNNNAIPYRALGWKSLPTVLPTPYFLFPNAKFEVTMNGFNTVPFTAFGEAFHQISFFGYRMRVEDAQNVLSTIFG